MAAHKVSILDLCVQCTKNDVTLNNYIARSKTLDLTPGQPICSFVEHCKLPKADQGHRGRTRCEGQEEQEGQKRAGQGDEDEEDS